MGGDFAEACRRGAAALDASLERAVARILRRSPRPPGPYAGIVTRGIAFGLDAGAVAAIFVALAAVGGVAWLLVGPLHRGWLIDVLLGGGLTVAAGAYFVVAWIVLGATAGMWFLALRVVSPSGGPPGLVRALLRYVFFVLSIALFFLGFVPILFDGRRRGLADWASGTTIQSQPAAPLPPARGG
jgi:uncharacterized RDD family membrane protein YckC